MQYDYVLSNCAPHASVCSTHWGNMHGLLGHSSVTLHTVMRGRVSIFAAFVSNTAACLQGDITDENFVQSVVEKVTSSHSNELAARVFDALFLRCALTMFSIWQPRQARCSWPCVEDVANTSRRSEFKRSKRGSPKVDFRREYSSTALFLAAFESNCATLLPSPLHALKGHSASARGVAPQ